MSGRIGKALVRMSGAKVFMAYSFIWITPVLQVFAAIQGLVVVGAARLMTYGRLLHLVYNLPLTISTPALCRHGRWCKFCPRDPENSQWALKFRYFRYLAASLNAAWDLRQSRVLWELLVKLTIKTESLGRNSKTFAIRN